MDFNIISGDTSKTIYVRLRDSTTGLAKTGLVFNSAGAIASYVLPLAARVAITLATQTVTGAWSSGGFVEVDATNAKGLYRLDLPDAAIASGSFSIVTIQFTGVIEEAIEIELHKRQVNAIQLSGDTTAADNAEAFFDGTGYAGTNNVIPTVSTITDSSTDINTILADAATLVSRLTASRAGYLDNLNIGGNVASSAEATAIQNSTRVVRVVPDVIERPDSGTVTYRIELLLYDDVGNMETPDSAPTIALVNQSGTDLSSRLDSATMALVSTGRYRAVYTASVGDTLEQLVWMFSVVEGGNTRLYGNASLIVDTTAVDFTAADRTKLDTLHDTRIPGVIQPQTGDSFAIVNSGTHGNAAIKGFVDDIGVAGAGLTAIPWNAAWDAEVQSEATDALVAYDPPTQAEMDARTLVAASYATATALATAQTAIDTKPTLAQILTTAMTEAYAADGAAPTLAQALFLIQQTIGDFAISGTTITVKKLDGSTTAATYTLDSSSAPTSRTRAT